MPNPALTVVTHIGEVDSGHFERIQYQTEVVLIQTFGIS